MGVDDNLVLLYIFDYAKEQYVAYIELYFECVTFQAFQPKWNRQMLKRLCPANTKE
jgi:hypothetical protein